MSTLESLFAEVEIAANKRIDDTLFRVIGFGNNTCSKKKERITYTQSRIIQHRAYKRLRDFGYTNNNISEYNTAEKNANKQREVFYATECNCGAC